MQSFHALHVAAGQETKLTIAEELGFHLSVLAAPHGASGKGVVYATVDGKAYAIGTVDTATKNFQVPVDLVFSGKQSVSFSVKGNVAVHLSGYTQEMEPANPFGSEDGSDDEDISDDEEVPAPKAKAPVAQAKKPAAPAQAEEESDDEEDDEEDDDEEGDL